MLGRALLLNLLMLMNDPAAFASKRFAKRAEMGDEANLDVGVALAVVSVVLGAVISMIVVAALFGPFTDAVADVNENLTTSDWGDDTTNSIAPVFAIVIGIGALAGIIGLILASFSKFKS
jgi:hypothetical protein